VRFLLALCLLFPLWVHAACSSCSTAAASCTAGSTAAQINTCIASLPDEGVITLANGTYPMEDYVRLDNMPNGMTLQCATVGGCTWTTQGDFIILENALSTNVTNLVRITGMVFNGSQGVAKIWLYDSNNNVEKLRIDNNTFQGGGTGAIDILLGEQTSAGRVLGVIDNNTFTGTTNRMAMKSISGNTTWQTGLAGAEGNMFFEDNTMDFDAYDDLGSGGVDVWRSTGVVVRYNDFFNSRIVNHSYCHEGPANAEVYGNVINAPDSGAPQYRNIHLQGPGEAIVFDNTIYGGHFAIQHFRADTSLATGVGAEGSCNSVCDGDVTGTGASASAANDGNRSGKVGYPCWHQLGRDANATLKPAYTWLNLTNTGTRVDADIEVGSWTGSNANCANTDSGRVNCHIQNNRDIYQAVSASAQSNATTPFNGTTGVGYGTLANRPTTCTTSSDSDDATGCSGAGCGVGYWATDGGSNWNTSNGAGNDGGLYICSNTDTWALYYTPYEYPHPLRDEAGSDNSWTRIAIFLSGFAMIGIALGALYGKGLARSAGAFRPFAQRNGARGTATANSTLAR
jgi:hypothetical protein